MSYHAIYQNSQSWGAHQISFPSREIRQKLQPKDDQPKQKRLIPGAEPWVIVITKKGRQFVHNLDTKISLWNAPQDVQVKIDSMGPPNVDAERAARKGRREKKALNQAVSNANVNSESALQDETRHSNRKELRDSKSLTKNQENYVEYMGKCGSESKHDHKECEQSEGEDQSEGDRPEMNTLKTIANISTVPVEFTEDDIAWQLEAMAEQYGLEEDIVDNGEDKFTDEENARYFMEMLDSYNINPYTTWELALPKIVDDSRYGVLSNTKTRKEVFTEWCKVRIAVLKAGKAKSSKVDPKISFWGFIKRNASMKLYWPEFKRKHRKAFEMKDSRLSDKDRERMYRDYLSRIKNSETIRETDFKKFLRHVDNLSCHTSLDNLPESVATDVRYVVCPEETRDRILREHLVILPEVPISDMERQRKRQKLAVSEREEIVFQYKKALMPDDLQAKTLMRQEEEVIRTAHQIGRKGLLYYIRKDGAIDK